LPGGGLFFHAAAMRFSAALLPAFALVSILDAQEPMKRVDAFDTSIEVPVAATPMPPGNPALVSFEDTLTGIKWLVERRGPIPSEKPPAPLTELGGLFAKGLRLPKAPELRTNTVAGVPAVLGGGSRGDAHFEYILCFRGGYIYGFVVGGPPRLADKIRAYRDLLRPSIRFTGRKVPAPRTAAPTQGLKAFGLDIPGIPPEKWRPMAAGGKIVGIQFFDAANKRVSIVMRQKMPGVKLESLDENFVRNPLGFKTIGAVSSRQLKVDGQAAVQHSFLKPTRDGAAKDRTVVLLIPRDGQVYLIVVTGPDDGTDAIQKHADELAAKARFIER